MTVWPIQQNDEGRPDGQAASFRDSRVLPSVDRVRPARDPFRHRGNRGVGAGSDPTKAQGVFGPVRRRPAAPGRGREHRTIMVAGTPLETRDKTIWDGGASFSRRNRLYRLAFIVTWGLLAAWTPPPLRGWRRLILRLFGARIAPTAIVYGSARIWSPANLTMEDHSVIGPRTTIYAMAPIRLGAYAIVSQGAHLCAGTHDVESPAFQLHTRPIVIGTRAWVAAEAFVGPGVTIGDGAVLGARAVAMRDIAAWTIAAGNPARPLRPRHIWFDAA